MVVVHNMDYPRNLQNTLNIIHTKNQPGRQGLAEKPLLSLAKIVCLRSHKSTTHYSLFGNVSCAKT